MTSRSCVASRLALEAGVAVLVEKPMAPTEDEALEVLRYAEDRGLLLGVGHVERFNPAVVALKQKLDDGLLGRVYQLHARRLSPFPNRDSMLGVAVDLGSAGRCGTGTARHTKSTLASSRAATSVS
jgi:UDP-N-acetylglucosamine 3-dehydrogenase